MRFISKHKVATWAAAVTLALSSAGVVEAAATGRAGLGRVPNIAVCEVDARGNPLNSAVARDAPAAANVLASAAIPVGQGCNVEVALPPGANAGTWVWVIATNVRVGSRINPMGGDTACSPGSATPTSFTATGSLDASGTQVDSTTMNLQVTWSGSDPGVVAQVSCYDEGVSPRAEVFCQTRTGPWNESASFPVTALTSVDHLVIEFQLTGVTLGGYAMRPMENRAGGSWAQGPAPVKAEAAGQAALARSAGLPARRQLAHEASLRGNGQEPVALARRDRAPRPADEHPSRVVAANVPPGASPAERPPAFAGRRCPRSDAGLNA
jgi:hypothetical protein